MIKLYRIFFLIIILLILTTYSPNDNKNVYLKSDSFIKIQKIKILGNELIDQNDIITRLSSIYKKNIFLIREDEIKNPLKSIDFLEKIEVKKKYPDTIIIKVYETKPLAILFKKNKRYFLDNKSNIILIKKKPLDDSLPKVFGDDAEKDFLNFYQELEDVSFPITKIKNFYYFQINRWDVEFFDNQIIKFPSNNIKKALQKSIELLNREDFKKYNIIDLRLEDKIIVN